MTFKEFFSFKSNKIFWLNLAGMIIFIVAGVFATMKWLDSYTMHGKSIAVPDLSRMTLNEARSILQKNGLEFAVTDSSYMRGVPAQTIIQQTPLPGQKVKEGRTIYLTISSAKIPLQKIPDVIDNSSLREAEARLVAAGFKVENIEYVDYNAKDWVLGLKYKGKKLDRTESIPEGSVIVIIAGNGNENITNEFISDNPATDIETNDFEDDDSWF